jgi:hypothetical protein
MATEIDLERLSRLVHDEIKDFREELDWRFQSLSERFASVSHNVGAY